MVYHGGIATTRDWGESRQVWPRRNNSSRSRGGGLTRSAGLPRYEKQRREPRCRFRATRTFDSDERRRLGRFADQSLRSMSFRQSRGRQVLQSMRNIPPKPDVLGLRGEHHPNRTLLHGLWKTRRIVPTSPPLPAITPGCLACVRDRRIGVAQRAHAVGPPVGAQTNLHPPRGRCPRRSAPSSTRHDPETARRDRA